MTPKVDFLALLRPLKSSEVCEVQKEFNTIEVDLKTSKIEFPMPKNL